MRTWMILLASLGLSFAAARTVEAAWSGGSSTCKTQTVVTATQQGTLAFSIQCTGVCQSGALGTGVCMPMKVSTTMLDHDANPQTAPIPVDVWMCGCRFENPLPEGGYIYVVDEVQPGVLECDAVGFTHSNQAPGQNGQVLTVGCTGQCTGGQVCLFDQQPPPHLPRGTSHVSSCSCQ